MKEIFSAFGSEVFRPLATIVIPGAMAISTWFCRAATAVSIIPKSCGGESHGNSSPSRPCQHCLWTAGGRHWFKNREPMVR